VFPPESDQIRSIMIVFSAFLGLSLRLLDLLFQATL
jgi:hypothetical protein